MPSPFSCRSMSEVAMVTGKLINLTSKLCLQWALEHDAWWMIIIASTWRENLFLTTLKVSNRLEALLEMKPISDLSDRNWKILYWGFKIARIKCDCSFKRQFSLQFSTWEGAAAANLWNWYNASGLGVVKEFFSKWLYNKVWEGHKTLSRKYFICGTASAGKIKILSQWGLKNLRILNWLFDMRVWGFTSSQYWWTICLDIVEPFLRFSWFIVSWRLTRFSRKIIRSVNFYPQKKKEEWLSATTQGRVTHLLL